MAEETEVAKDPLAGWERKEPVTGRPNDTPPAPDGPVRNSTLASRKNGTEAPVAPPPAPNSTLAERAAARKGGKAVAKAENKAVADEDAEEKAAPKRTTRKKAS